MRNLGKILWDIRFRPTACDDRSVLENRESTSDWTGDWVPFRIRYDTIESDITTRKKNKQQQPKQQERLAHFIVITSPIRRILDVESNSFRSPRAIKATPESYVATGGKLIEVVLFLLL